MQAINCHRASDKMPHYWSLVNPNCARRGQSWPRQLWHQIPDKILMYKIFLNTCSYRNVFWVFLNLRHDIKKWCFDVHFDVFSSEVRPKCHPANPPFCSVLLLLQTIRGWEKARRAVFRSPAWGQSGFQSVSRPGHTESRVWRVLSRACSLALSKGPAGAAPFRASPQNQSALLHTCQITEDINLHLVKARSILSRPRYLTGFPKPSSVRV